MADRAQHIQPVFLIHKSLPAVEEKEYSVADICLAAERTAGFESVEGAQRIGGQWRVYPKNMEARFTLLIGDIVLKHHTVQPKDKKKQKNFIARNEDGDERETPSSKLVIGNIPMSFNNDKIVNGMEKMGVKSKSKLLEERDERLSPSGSATQGIPVQQRIRDTNLPAQPQSSACLLYTSPSPRDISGSRMPSSA